MAWQAPLSTTGMSNALLVAGDDDVYIGTAVTLVSTSAGGVVLSGSDQQVIVHGTVAGQTAIVGFHADHTEITVSHTGVVSGLDGYGIGYEGAFLTLRNAGLIETGTGAGSAVRLEGDTGFETHSVENTGTIRGHIGIDLGPDLSGFKLVNDGTLAGTSRAFIDQGFSQDEIINNGIIKGTVRLGGGDDLFDSRNGTVISLGIEGGVGQDRIYTAAGNQTLYGNAGYDTLMGGAGADILVGGADKDTASYANAAAGVTANLANAATNTGDAKGDAYWSIEWLTGSKFADKLFGNDGDNLLAGGSGADTLTGGAGADRFVFSVKPSGSATADRITDFQTDLDELRLNDANFAGLAKGDLAGAAFWASASGAAHDGTDRVIYETDTGWLRFDADGNGAGAAVAFARLAAGLNLGADDIFVY